MLGYAQKKHAKKNNPMKYVITNGQLILNHALNVSDTYPHDPYIEVGAGCLHDSTTSKACNCDDQSKAGP